jgi:hypothetical protein
VDLNLETLKREILAHLEASEFGVFYGLTGALEDLPMVLWDVERYPDYRMFLDAARKSGAKLVIFAASEFESSELDELEEHVEVAGLTREEQREYSGRVRELRRHEGSICTLELAFECGSRLYVYELQPDWYDDFVNLEEEIMSQFGDAEDDSLGGFYSKN